MPYEARQQRFLYVHTFLSPSTVGCLNILFLCIYTFGVYTERFWLTRRSCNQGFFGCDGSWVIDSRRTVSVIWVGCYRVITIPLEEENYLDTAGKVCKPMMELLYLDISSFTPLCLSLSMHIPSRQAVAFI